jgi:predicted amidohydrolase
MPTKATEGDQPRLEYVGFYHCPTPDGDPFGLLAAALQRERDARAPRGITASLIVLPEAFNLGKPYYAPRDTTNVPGMARIALDIALSTLGNLSSVYGVVFVAGLTGVSYTSAYWVAPDNPPILMCHKRSDDKTQNYVVASVPDRHNPVDHRGVCAGALVCLDALNELDVRERRAQLLDRMTQSAARHKIVCVPARMSAHCKPAFDGFTWVLANSVGQHSMVVDPQGQVLAEEPDQQNDHLRIVDLPL